MKTTLFHAALITFVVTILSVTITCLAGVIFSNTVSITAIVVSAVIPIAIAFPSLYLLITKFKQLTDQHQSLEIAHAELQAHAKIDHMTGLLNRQTLLDAIKISRSRIDTGALLMIDADHFKIINDNFGHATGDKALKLIALAIKSVTRRGDLVGRIGGEEFCVFLPNANEETAKRVAERIRAEVETTPFYSKNNNLHPLTISIGATTAPKSESNSQIMSRADRNLYIAKQRGRNCVIFVGTAISQPQIITAMRAKSA